MIILDNPATVPAPAGQYSHVARVDLGDKTILQLSGQVAIDADRKIVGEDMTTQANFIVDNVTAILAAHGATLADVVNLLAMCLASGEIRSGRPRVWGLWCAAGCSVRDLCTLCRWDLRRAKSSPSSDHTSGPDHLAVDPAAVVAD